LAPTYSLEPVQKGIKDCFVGLQEKSLIFGKSYVFGRCDMKCHPPVEVSFTVQNQRLDDIKKQWGYKLDTTKLVSTPYMWWYDFEKSRLTASHVPFSIQRSSK